MRFSSKDLQLAFILVLFYSPVSVAWSSVLPSSIRALKGSCVVIPCSFTFPGSRASWGGKFSMAWYQYQSRGYPEIYNSKSLGSVLPVYKGRTEMLGDLEMGNCTLSINPVRSGDAMSYYVWINPDSVKHRFYDVTVRVDIADTPSQLELSDPGLLTEGNRTLITCSVMHTCPLAPPTLTWNLVGGKTVTVQKRLAGGAWRTESEFNYIPSHKDHSKYLQCTATFPNQQQCRNGIYLQVKYSPKNTVVSVVGNPNPKEGDNVTLRCSSQSNPPAVNYLWFFGHQKAPLQAADKPVILPQRNCTMSRTGETVTCYCMAEGNPLPDIEWRLPNRTVPGDFNSSELQAALASWGQAIVGVLSGPASSLANVSCAATNHHGPSQSTVPTIQAADISLLLMASGGAVGGLLFFVLMGTVVYKVAKSRKKGQRQEDNEEQEDPTLSVTDENREQKTSLKVEKPSRFQKEEPFNMYTKSKAGRSLAAGNDLSAEAYESMGIVEDYENVPAGGPTGLYGNLGNWHSTSGTDQIYSNV
ncbi:myelin-associated glycoprotein-like isoform X2 [Rhineura floridana]|uniref:myelin-associated glycoprotein-like isoform X2 n=1 Tax=Rhineura floridana TaxID=261503 RepID=UPI002AC82219|nr:myelin-associated glycoprotein-like isoform X2 [Rhineura floridana]